VLAAEHQLKAANANIGAARAAFFHVLLFTASAELPVPNYPTIQDRFRCMDFAPQIIMPIFDARTWSAYDVPKLKKKFL